MVLPSRYTAYSLHVLHAEASLLLVQGPRPRLQDMQGRDREACKPGGWREPKHAGISRPGRDRRYYWQLAGTAKCTHRVRTHTHMLLMHRPVAIGMHCLAAYGVSGYAVPRGTPLTSCTTGI